jgi:hypothetical protein
MSEDWVWNDPDISDDSVVYRKVLARPGFLVPDLEGNRPPSPAPGAFKCDPDGISVYRDELLAKINKEPEDVKKNPDDLIFGVLAQKVRDAGAGVVDTPDPEDEVLGEAHASIRYQERSVNKKTERAVREKIIAACWLKDA